MCERNACKHADCSESTDDDSSEGVSTLGGGGEREVAAEDGDEREDTESAVALEADGSGELRFSGRACDPESGGERRVGAEVERVGGRSHGLAANKWIGGRRVGGSGDPDRDGLGG